jgi:RNA polymerase sigma-70 factor (ECF subfamily)
LASKLKPIYAEVLGLRYSFEYSDIEIAELLGISHDTVRTRLHRARKQLQAYYDDEGEN